MSKEEVRQKLDIAELIGGYVQLKPVGHGRLKGLCPFHQEKSPSFQVDTQRGFYYCFGCKAGGDAFSFLQQIEGVSFSEALERLALRTGVTLEHRPKEKHHRDIYEVNELALGYFKDNLNPEVTSYLVSRGINADLIKRFEIGYAPNGWDGLMQHAKAKGIDERQLKQAGLISENEAGRLYDKFRHRVMFPIRDVLGRLVGFGGRVLDDSKPKYLNTPETEVFKKGELLYGLHLSGKRSELIIVEGYLDVIAMHGAGYTQTVATLGTSLTADHTYLLARQGVSKLSLMFDADNAGRKATLSGLGVVGAQLEVKACTLPNGKDPADAVLAGDIEGIQAALRHGLDEVALRVDLACDGVDIATTEGKRVVLQRLLPRMQQQDITGAAEMLAGRLREQVAHRLGIDEQRLIEWVTRNTKTNTKHAQISDTQVRGMTDGSAEMQRELHIAMHLLQQPSYIQHLEDPGRFKHPLLRQLIEIVLHNPSQQAILDAFRGKPEENTILQMLFQQQNYDLTPSETNRKLLQEFQGLQRRSLIDTESRHSEDFLKSEVQRLKQTLKTADPQEYAHILGQIVSMQAAIEAERRTRSMINKISDDMSSDRED